MVSQGTSPGTLTRPPKSTARPFNLVTGEAAGQVVVDEAHGLHKGVDVCRADERPASALQVLTHRHGLWARRLHHLPREWRRTVGRVGFEPPDIAAKAADLAHQVDA